MPAPITGKEGSKEDTMRARTDPGTGSRRSRPAMTVVTVLAVVAFGLGLVALARAPVEVGRDALEPAASRMSQPERATWAPAPRVAYFPAQFGTVAGSVDPSPPPSF